MSEGQAGTEPCYLRLAIRPAGRRRQCKGVNTVTITKVGQIEPPTTRKGG